MLLKNIKIRIKCGGLGLSSGGVVGSRGGGRPAATEGVRARARDPSFLHPLPSFLRPRPRRRRQALPPRGSPQAALRGALRRWTIAPSDTTSLPTLELRRLKNFSGHFLAHVSRGNHVKYHMGFANLVKSGFKSGQAAHDLC